MSVIDFVAVLASWTAGALCLWWADGWLVGLSVCVVLAWVYHRFVRDRVEERVRQGATAPVSPSHLSASRGSCR
ncbi:peptidoglycan/LPS O-acetylase OafA/YrhL [Phycicoccus badiiscoriae]|uniref:Peptidoglycan/LPS O-acetylase OafA/YrhL n=1 Tax=Pedococcus badiiscoriae TaxID=642776 RepID=A0A852WN64_9MICO|nr:peptidoglycan/LPS O-acetylase OafA/YrhL [Pedococcus badiiscoriae]